MDMNVIFLTGFVGKDPEYKSGDNWQCAKFSMATNRKAKGKEYTTWHYVSVWGLSAEFVKEHVRKGMRVSVVGRLEVRDVDDKRYVSVEVDAFGGKLNVESWGKDQDGRERDRSERQARDDAPIPGWPG